MVPVYGILFLNWNLAVILLIYWLESSVIGFYAVLKMLIAPGGIKKIFLIPFFFIHFGAFMLGHLIAIVVFLVDFFKIESLDLNQLKLFLLVSFLSHGASFILNFIGKKEYEKTNVGFEMAAPYKRIFLMQFTIVIGAFLYLNLKLNSNVILILLIVLKTGVDLFSHLKEHNKFSTFQAVTPQLQDSQI